MDGWGMAELGVFIGCWDGWDQTGLGVLLGKEEVKWDELPISSIDPTRRGGLMQAPIQVCIMEHRL